MSPILWQESYFYPGVINIDHNISVYLANHWLAPRKGVNLFRYFLPKMRTPLWLFPPHAYMHAWGGNNQCGVRIVGRKYLNRCPSFLGVSQWNYILLWFQCPFSGKVQQVTTVWVLLVIVTMVHCPLSLHIQFATCSDICICNARAVRDVIKFLGKKIVYSINSEKVLFIKLSWVNLHTLHVWPETRF